MKEIALTDHLSARALNVCISAGIDTLGKLLEKTSADIAHLPNCGAKTIAELRAIRVKYRALAGCTFFGVTLEGKPDVNGFISDCFLPAYELALTRLSREEHDVLEQNLGDIQQFVADSLTASNQFLKQRHESVEPSRRATLNKALTALYEACLAEVSPMSDRYRVIKDRINYLKRLAGETSYEDFFYSLSERARELLNDNYHRLFCHLPLRTRNVFAEFDNFPSMLPYVLGRKHFVAKNLTGCGKKATLEIQNLLETVRQEYITFVDRVGLADSNLDQWFRAAQHKSIAAAFPFLEYDEIRSVINSDTDARDLPRLGLVLRYIQRNTSRDTRTFCLCFGLDGNPPKSMQEVAAEIGVAPERVRQILMEGVKFPAAMLPVITSLKAELKEDIYPESHPFWKKIAAMETDRLPDLADLSLVQLMGLFVSLSTEFMVVKVNANSRHYLVRRSLMKGIKLNTSIQYMRQMACTPKTEPTTVDFADALFLGADREGFSNDAEKLYCILADFARPLKRVTIDGDGCGCHIEPNKVEVGPAVEQMLREHEGPMTFGEIVKEFGIRYPYFQINSLNSFKNYILRHAPIGHIGRTERYVLREWDHSYCGSMIDYLQKILEDAEDPLYIKEICRQASIHFPDTKIHSVNVQLCSDKRFTSYGNWYFGLTGRTYTEAWKERRELSRVHTIDERFAQLEEFVREKGRFPISSFKDTEGPLYRWYKRALDTRNSDNSDIHARVEKLIADNPLAPCSACELNFKTMSERVMTLLEKENRLPESNGEKDLYNWLQKVTRQNARFGDRRDIYLSTLRKAIANLC